MMTPANLSRSIKSKYLYTELCDRWVDIWMVLSLLLLFLLFLYLVKSNFCWHSSRGKIFVAENAINLSQLACLSFIEWQQTAEGAVPLMVSLNFSVDIF